MRELMICLPTQADHHSHNYQTQNLLAVAHLSIQVSDPDYLRPMQQLQPQ